MEARGQQMINWQLIDNADLVVALFWHRLGTPTGLYESGTAEEISRAQAKGIEIMLYFSDIEDTRPLDDPEQWNRLQTFRAKALASGLPWTFRSRQEFRDRFADHLSKKIPEIISQKSKKSAKEPTASIRQTQSGGTGNFQIAGHGNTLNLKSDSLHRPKIVIQRSPGELTPAEQKEIGEWIEELSILMENAEGKTTKQAKSALWSRLKNHFNVAKYEQIESSRMPEVKAWYQAVKRETRNNARRRKPKIFKTGKIPGIKARMRQMGKTNEDYYPEIAHRLGIRRFSSLNDLSTKNLERVYRLVLRDASGQ